MSRSKNLPRGPAFPTDDPYLRWNDATGYRYLPPGSTWIPVLVQLKPRISVQAFESPAWRNGPPYQGNLVIPSIYEAPPRATRGRHAYATAYIRILAFAVICADPGWTALVSGFVAGQPVEPSLMPLQWLTWPPQTTLPATGKVPADVVVAVIDDGIAFADQRLLDETGRTRLQAFWDQDTTTALSGPQIDNGISSFRFGSLVDEDALYRSAGLDNYSDTSHKRTGHRISHGSHVLEVATALLAGDPSSRRPIIAVQLPRLATTDTSGDKLAPYIADALNFIEWEMNNFVASNGSVPPLVVNISYGMTGGPQDGSSFTEKMIDQFVSGRNAAGLRTEVVIAAGNSRLARSHAIVQLDNVAPKAIEWRVLPDDRTPSALEIWLPAGQRVAVRVQSPTGAFTGWVNQGGQYPNPLSPNAPCTIQYTSPATLTGRQLVLVQLLPTGDADPFAANPTAAAGGWRLHLRGVWQGVPPSPFNVDVYVRRDDTPVGYKVLGRQSYVEDPNYMRLNFRGAPQEWDLPDPAPPNGAPPIVPPNVPPIVRRAGTLNAIATGKQPYIVGAVRRSDLTSATYSSMGAASTSRCPNIAAASDDSVAARGILAAGSRTGSTVALDGTSVAAPQLTRWIAATFANGPITRAALDALLIGSLMPATNVPAPVRKQAVGRGLLILPQVITSRSKGQISR